MSDSHLPLNNRISSIDFFRTISIFSVILAHTSPFKDSDSIISESLYIGINNATRFAVPFFFIVAGYFWGGKIQSGAIPGVLFKKYIKRLMPLFFIWSIIYLILPTNIKEQVIKYGLWEATYQKIYIVISEPITFLFQGGRSHLWFLISFIIAIGILTIFLRLNRKQWIMPIAFLLYFFGIIAGPYSATPFGINISFNTVHGPFFSTLFVAIGWALSSGKFQIRPAYAIGLAITGMIMHMVEVFCLWQVFLIDPTGKDYVFGTFLWSAGLSMYILSRPRLFESSLITKWGPYALGIYLLHFIVLDMLTPLNKLITFPLWDIINPFIIYFLSLWIVWALSKNKLSKRLVAY